MKKQRIPRKAKKEYFKECKLISEINIAEFYEYIKQATKGKTDF